MGLAALVFLPPLVVTAQGCQGTCTTLDDCPDGQFCSMAAGVCATSRAIGFCKDIPLSCPDVLQVACGCDGKTYDNICQASLAGQSAAYPGACTVACGGPADTKCPAGDYCVYTDGVCSSSSVAGTCTPIPANCSDATPSAVCGCDGKTYDSRCAASLAGVGIATTGACSCGGPGNTKCETGKYCNYAVGTCAGANPAGTCASPPKTCQPFSSPVCGCDGKTYDNACEAAKAQTGLYSATTACPCGGPNNAKCASDEYCEFGMIGTCLGANPTGVCKVKPTSCTGVSSSVCGCDGMPYDNACEAAKAGTSVAANGSCVIP